ncbi:MAG TPA: M14 family zinc carboxypeptidase [Thermoanaerobaculia bacterium]|nr:M14 family zinc carboxypeptidase [Thermoanaerobaculia bacterium]
MRKIVCGLLLSACVASVASAQEAPIATSPPLLAPLTAGEILPLPAVDGSVPSPAAVLGRPLGQRFTRHHELGAYFATLAAASPRVATWSYGTTWLDRPLHLVAVSSAGNLARLDEIHLERQRLVDPSTLAAAEREALIERLPAIVWLAYGVHGDEASSSEAAMATAYLLAAAEGPLADALERVVVLIDPASNPDGRERYLAAYEDRRGAAPSPRPAAAEHHQPWPGGRTNHYLFDLNRDWTWGTQRETRARLAAVQEWQPQVYVDFHEMSSSDTYFFPPSAEPVNRLIDPRVVGWLETFGRRNAAVFDQLGWIYFKAESYDLFYPGYADSYLSLRGAVGMTYEMAGGGTAGLVVERRDGSLLSLADRVARHLATSLATVETAAAGSTRLLRDFVATRVAAAEAPGDLYLWAADGPEATVLADLLRLHGIEVRTLATAVTTAARAIGGEPIEGRHFAAGTWVVSTGQPLGLLARALLDTDSPLDEDFVAAQRRRVEEDLDSAFYDITAWSLPLAFNLPAWRVEAAAADLVTTAAGVGASRDVEEPAAATAEAAGAIGWLLPPSGLAAYRVAAGLQREGVRFRVALDDIGLGGRGYPAGTLFVPRLGNPAATGALLALLAAESGQPVDAVSTSYASDGISLGSPQMADVGVVRAAVVGGEGVRSSSFGSLWYLLDRQVAADPVRLDVGVLAEVDLGDLDVLVLPDGAGYDRAIDDDTAAAIESWLRGGGIVVAVGGAIDWLRGRKLTSVDAWQPEAAAGDPESLGADTAAHATGAPGVDLTRRALDVPGAILATALAPGHPLGVGVAAAPPVLFDGSQPLLATGGRRVDVLTVVAGDPVLAGFVWPESRPRLAGALLVAAEPVGRGWSVMFSQDPAFRGFWRGTFPLLLNAVIYGPTLLAADHAP